MIAFSISAVLFLCFAISQLSRSNSLPKSVRIVKSQLDCELIEMMQSVGFRPDPNGDWNLNKRLVSENGKGDVIDRRWVVSH